MTEIINQIPGFEKGSVQYVCATDEVGAIFLAAKMVSDLLNKWNTNVAFFSLSSRSKALLELVKADSCFARIYTVNQKNHNLQVILRKAKGMVNRKSVRAIIIEGLPELDAVGKRWLEQLAKSTNTSIVVVTLKQTNLVNTITTGYPSLDSFIGGWQKGDLIVIGARPTVGKTAFGLDIAINVAMNMKKPVMYYSLEMPAEQVMKRLLLKQVKTEGISNLNKTEWQQLEKRLIKLSKSPLYINATPRLSISDFCETAKSNLSEIGLKLIIIDYLQLMQGRPEYYGKVVPEVNDIIQMLKKNAMALGIPIIVLAQMKRLLRKDNIVNRKPTLKDFWAIDAVEEYADVVILLDRPSEEEINEHPEAEGNAEFIVSVNKHGNIGSVSVHFDKSGLSFIDPLAL